MGIEDYAITTHVITTWLLLIFLADIFKSLTELSAFIIGKGVW